MGGLKFPCKCKVRKRLDLDCIRKLVGHLDVSRGSVTSTLCQTVLHYCSLAIFQRILVHEPLSNARIHNISLSVLQRSINVDTHKEINFQLKPCDIS